MALKRVALLIIPLSLLALFAANGGCQPLGPESLNDGRLWNDMNTTVKTVYLIGYMDAACFVSLSAAKSSEGSPDEMFRRFYPTGPETTGAQLLQALDGFYANPQNLRIPIPHAIQLVAARASGLSAVEVERRIEILRRAIRVSPLP
jgi:hypothetical protein